MYYKELNLMNKWLHFPYSWIPGAKGRAEEYLRSYITIKVEEEIMFNLARQRNYLKS